MTFSLKQKLFAAFGVLLLITAFIGFQSIRRFERLGKSSADSILQINQVESLDFYHNVV